MTRSAVEAMALAGARQGPPVPGAALRYLTRAAVAGAFIFVGAAVQPVRRLVLRRQPAPGKLLASDFSAALILIVLLGGELFTGCNLVMGVSLYEGSATPGTALRVWIMAYVGNCIGILALCLLLAGSGASSDLLSAYLSLCVPAKLAAPWYMLLLRGVLCNFLVCVGVFAGFRLQSECGQGDRHHPCHHDLRARRTGALHRQHGLFCPVRPSGAWRRFLRPALEPFVGNAGQSSGGRGAAGPASVVRGGRAAAARALTARPVGTRRGRGQSVTSRRRSPSNFSRSIPSGTLFPSRRVFFSLPRRTVIWRTGPLRPPSGRKARPVRRELRFQEEPARPADGSPASLPWPSDRTTPPRRCTSSSRPGPDGRGRRRRRRQST